MNKAAIKVPITDLNPEFVRDLQEKYPDAQVTVTTTFVANGRDFYTKVLNKPDLISKENSFEPILYLAEHAYRLKTGRDDYDYLPSTCYETFGNEKGWPNGPRLETLLHGMSEGI